MQVQSFSNLYFFAHTFQLLYISVYIVSTVLKAAKEGQCLGICSAHICLGFANWRVYQPIEGYCLFC